MKQTQNFDGLFDQCSNMFGKLQPQIRKRLEAVIRDPVKHWDANHGIILSGDRWITLWQAVIAIDPTFPRVGPATDQHGKKLEDWKRYPDRDTILKAILYAAAPKNVREAQVYNDYMLSSKRA